MLAGPVIASFLRSALATYGIDAPERSVSDGRRMEDKEHKRISTLLEAALEKTKPNDAGGELLAEMAEAEAGEMSDPETLPDLSMSSEQEEMPMEEAMIEEESIPMPEQENGIMSRGNM